MAELEDLFLFGCRELGTFSTAAAHKDRAWPLADRKEGIVHDPALHAGYPKWFGATDRDSSHAPRGISIVITRVMHRCPVVPQHHVAGFPLMADDEFWLCRMSKEEPKKRIAFEGRKSNDVTRKPLIHKE